MMMTGGGAGSVGGGSLAVLTGVTRFSDFGCISSFLVRWRGVFSFFLYVRISPASWMARSRGQRGWAGGLANFPLAELFTSISDGIIEDFGAPQRIGRKSGERRAASVRPLEAPLRCPRSRISRIRKGPKFTFKGPFRDNFPTTSFFARFVSFHFASDFWGPPIAVVGNGVISRALGNRKIEEVRMCYKILQSVRINKTCPNAIVRVSTLGKKARLWAH